MANPTAQGGFAELMRTLKQLAPRSLARAGSAAQACVAMTSTKGKTKH